MINNNQRKKENTALSEGSLEPRSSLDNATIDREKGTKDVDNHADVNNKMKDKPLSEKRKELRLYAQRNKMFSVLIVLDEIEKQDAEAVKKSQARKENQLRIHWNWLKNKPYEEVVLFLNAIDNKIMGNFK